jgi:hypothetical protein
MIDKPKRSLLERTAAVLSPIAFIAKVIYDLFLFMHFGIQH